MGWIATLSARAIANLLALMDYSTLIVKQDDTFWVPPSRAKELYSLSPETWARGTAELVERGIVSTKMKYFKEDPLASLRRRKEYSIELSRFLKPPSPTPVVQPA
jgi:hypothetical protein